MPLLHDGLVFIFTHGSSKYNDRQTKIETQEEEEEAKEFALFRQEMMQGNKKTELAGTACKKQRTD